MLDASLWSMALSQEDQFPQRPLASWSARENMSLGEPVDWLHVFIADSKGRIGVNLARASPDRLNELARPELTVL